ncbi:MAG: Multidrug resistance protein MdtA precursor, partial [Pseudomonadota bacterium]
MANKTVYSIAAVLGIAGASGAAWWYQQRPTAPKEVAAASAPAGAASAPAGASSGPGGAGGPARPAGVEVAKVEKGTLQDDAQGVGSLRSRQSVMLRPEVPGRVKSLGFSDGQRVRKGQLLVQLDDVLQKAEVKQARAQVSIALANYKRNQELVAQNFVAQRVLEESSAGLQVAEAQLALACARLQRMGIVAPFDGTVGLRNVNLGDFVKDGADLINLEDIGSMYVDFRLPERFQGKLRLQQPVEVTLDAMPGRMFKARIEALDPLLDANGRSVGVRAVLPNTMGEPAAAREGGGRPGGPGAAGGAAAPARAASAPAPRGPANLAAAGARPRSAQAGGRSPGGGRPATGTAQTAASGVDADGCPVVATTAVDVPAPSAGGRPPAGGRPGAAAGGGNSMPLRPGMFARVNTVFSINEGALMVPEEAIVPQGGRQFVFKVVEPEAVPTVDKAALPPDTKFVSQRQEVRLGVRRGGKVQITDGLTEAQVVVVAGHQRL